MEREIESSDANGPVDYIFKYRALICVLTEGKYESQNSDVSQNIACCS